MSKQYFWNKYLAFQYYYIQIHNSKGFVKKDVHYVLTEMYLLQLWNPILLLVTVIILWNGLTHVSL